MARRCVYLANLPLTNDDVLERDTELILLNTAWETGHPQIVALIAPAGMGKTALVSVWLRQMRTEEYRGAARVIGWSFPEITSAETAADEFLVYALNLCGDLEPMSGSAWNKGRRLAGLLATQRTLVILENIDALQYHDGDQQGRLKDPGLKALLHTIYHQQMTGVTVILTTTLLVKECEHWNAAAVKQITLSALTQEAGAQVLVACGVRGTWDELKSTSGDFDGHPLALTLLGGYLRFIHRGDIRKLDLNPSLTKNPRADRHVRRVVDAFTIWLQRRLELDILIMLGQSDLVFAADALTARTQPGILAAFLRAPAIKGFTEHAHVCSEDDWQAALHHLQQLRLITSKTIFDDPISGAEPQEPDQAASHRVIDCHPLIRVYFAEQFRQRLPGSWREVQNRLYEFYVQPADQNPPEAFQTIKPLLAAVRYGCQAGKAEQVFEDIYWRRIHRETEDFCAQTLGAPGTDLVALSYFFTPQWTFADDYISDEMLVCLLDAAALRLEEAGRLREAIELVKQGIVFWNRRANWEKAAEYAARLSRLLLPSGEVEQAVIHARLAWQLAEQHQDLARSLPMRIRLIRALHLSGSLQEMELLCQETQVMYAQQILDKLAPGEPFTDVACCDLLLHERKYQDVQDRITRRIEGIDGTCTPLDIAVGNLLSGKTLLAEAQTEAITDAHQETLLALARASLNQAIDALWDIGALEWLLQALLARAMLNRITRGFRDVTTDLEALRELADLGGMPLYLADYHIETARLLYEQFATNQGRFSSDPTGEEWHQRMHDHVEKAEALIWMTGYHLRDADLEILMTLLKEAIPLQFEVVEVTKNLNERGQLLRPVEKPGARHAPQLAPRPQQLPARHRPLPQEQEIPRPAEQRPPKTSRRVLPELEIPQIAAPLLDVSSPAPPRRKTRRLTPHDQEIRWVERQEQKINRAEEYEQLYLYPGEVHIAEEPTVVWTLLGSCVSVILYNERLRVGAICHAQLPEERYQDGTRDPCLHPCYKGEMNAERFKYVTCSIRYMYDQFIARGIRPDEITVKLFGGASVLEGVSDKHNVGDNNIRIAYQVLQEYQLKIVKTDLGGKKGRTIYFYSDTGEVFMRKHRSRLDAF